jgi:hypothetical protein
MNILNNISKVYLETIATEAAKPDYLDFDKDGNKKESMKKALKDKKEVAEAVRGQDTEMRKAASAERQAERKERGGAAPKIPGKHGPSAGKSYADYQQVSIAAHDKATKGKKIHGLAKESLDPVGQEDADIDNDGKSNTKSDKYLMNRRKVRGAAISTRKESFSNWRQDLSEVMDKTESDTEDNKQIKEKKNINNKIVINPDFKEAVEELGGVLLETVEVDEAYQPIDKDKENRMYRRAGNLARTAVSSTGKKKEVAQTKSSKIVSAITRQKEKERFDRIGQSPTHNEAFVDPEHGETPSGRTPLENVSDHPKASVRKTAVKAFKKQMGKEYGGSWKSRSSDPVGEEFKLDEKTLTPAETKKKEEIVKSMKKSAGDFEKRYPGRGKEVMYATATKQAKKLAEADMPQETQPSEKRAQTQQKQRLLQILQQKERAVRSGMTDISASYEPEGEVLPEDKALDLVRQSVIKQHGASSVMGTPEHKAAIKKQPKETPEQKRKRISNYMKKTSDYLKSSPRD